MKNYLNLLSRVLENGVYRDDRTGTGTWSVFGEQERFSLNDKFPLLTTKKLHLRSIIFELLWFLKGGTNVKYLQENKVKFGTSGQTKWRSWQSLRCPMDELGKTQWRSY